MTTYKVGYIVGSLAGASVNRTLAKALIRLAPPELEFVEIPIKDLPLYSYDYDAHFPASGRALKHALASVDAVLFVTPEYNRSIPGGLKNAIDWASRPPGQNSFAGKPSAVIGASPGKLGTALAQHGLRAVLGYLDSPQMNTPEAYVHLTPGLLTHDGDVTDASTAGFLQKFVTEFHAFIDMVHTHATLEALGSGLLPAEVPDGGEGEDERVASQGKEGRRRGCLMEHRVENGPCRRAAWRVPT